MRYRRADVSGGTYFFTVALADRKDDLLVREIIRLRAAMRTVCCSELLEMSGNLGVAIRAITIGRKAVWWFTLQGRTCVFALVW